MTKESPTTTEWEKIAAKIATDAFKKRQSYAEFSEAIYQGLSSLLQAQQKAVMDVLPKEKEFDRDIDGSYSFGRNQKTIGFNSALSEVRTALNELFSKQI